MADLLTEFLRIDAVTKATGLSQSTIYDRISRGAFPRPVPLGDAPNSPVGWLPDEVAAWQKSRIQKRNENAAA